jgi:hypothetical protein
MSKPGADPSSGISSVDVLILTERHPTCRQREARHIDPISIHRKRSEFSCIGRELMQCEANSLCGSGAEPQLYPADGDRKPDEVRKGRKLGANQRLNVHAPCHSLRTSRFRLAASAWMRCSTKSLGWRTAVWRATANTRLSSTRAQGRL